MPGRAPGRSRRWRIVLPEGYAMPCPAPLPVFAGSRSSQDCALICVKLGSPLAAVSRLFDVPRLLFAPRQAILRQAPASGRVASSRRRGGGIREPPRPRPPAPPDRPAGVDHRMPLPARPPPGRENSGAPGWWNARPSYSKRSSRLPSACSRARPRASAICGSTSSTTVRSGQRSPVDSACRVRISASASPRPPPW